MRKHITGTVFFFHRLHSIGSQYHGCVGTTKLGMQAPEARDWSMRGDRRLRLREASEHEFPVCRRCSATPEWDSIGRA